MTSFFIIRLGADSENEIKKIDNVVSYEQTSFSIYVNCKQIPKGVSEGDIAIIWLGTNNNKGGKPLGFRAFVPLVRYPIFKVRADIMKLNRYKFILE